MLLSEEQELESSFVTPQDVAPDQEKIFIEIYFNSSTKSVITMLGSFFVCEIY